MSEPSVYIDGKLIIEGLGITGETGSGTNKVVISSCTVTTSSTGYFNFTLNGIQLTISNCGFLVPLGLGQNCPALPAAYDGTGKWFSMIADSGYVNPRAGITLTVVYFALVNKSVFGL